MSTRPSSVNVLADYLTAGYWQDKGQTPHHFDGHDITVSLGGLSQAGKVLARAALDAWSAVANLHFHERSSGADITFSDAGSGASTHVSYSGHSTLSANVGIGAGWLDLYGRTVGSYGFQTYIHEIGHALGLGHAGNYDGGASIRQARFASDSWQATVMSYFDQDENRSVAATKAYVTTPMMADILAIQKLYGKAHGGETSGATSWCGKAGLGHSAMTIWDEGGRDTINLGGDNHDNRITLASGSYSDACGQIGNLGIAGGTVIENLVTGSGDDRVTGNGVANSLLLGRGDDWADGKEGNDSLNGQEGSDSLRGGDGNDRLTGGVGADSFVFAKGADIVTDFEDNRDTLVLDRSLWGGDAISPREALQHAHVDNGDILFDFGNGNTLRVQHMTNLDALADDIAFV